MILFVENLPHAVASSTPPQKPRESCLAGLTVLGPSQKSQDSVSTIPSRTTCQDGQRPSLSSCIFLTDSPLSSGIERSSDANLSDHSNNVMIIPADVRALGRTLWAHKPWSRASSETTMGAPAPWLSCLSPSHEVTISVMPYHDQSNSQLLLRRIIVKGSQGRKPCRAGAWRQEAHGEAMEGAAFLPWLTQPAFF